MSYAVQYLPRALRNIQEIKNYISQDNPSAAERLANEVKCLISGLAEMPERYAKYQYNPAYRKIPIGNYLIFYKIDADKKIVKIHLVTHAMRKLDGLLR